MTGAAVEQEQIERIIFGFAVQAQKQMTSDMEERKQRVIVLSGPTGSGKTNFSIDLAKEIGGEIISADSMQVYRGMDIGTDKAGKELQEEIPHHLIDIRDITDHFNVVDFYYEARQCCQQILSRGNIPIVVGGSGFYLHSFLYGPPMGPPSVPELRQSLEKEIEEKGSEALFHRLKELDPVYASTITKNDKQKIVRALEIITLCGKPVSKLSWKGKKSPKNFDFRCWFLYRPRDKLYKRIEDRCDRMVERGLLDEVRWLMEQGLEENPSASQAIGYRQAIEFLKSGQTDEEFDKFMKEIKRTSCKYVKRQFTWFRKEPLFRWLDLDMHDPEIAIEMIRQDYEAGR